MHSKHLTDDDLSAVAECLGWRQLFAWLLQQSGGTIEIDQAAIRDTPRRWRIARVPDATDCFIRFQLFDEDILELSDG